MDNIIQFPQKPRQSTISLQQKPPGKNENSADILLFTGIYYSRYGNKPVLSGEKSATDWR